MQNERLVLGGRLLSRIDLVTAADREAARPPNLLPSRTVENVVAADREAFADWLQNQCEVGIDIPPAEIIWATKARMGARPAAVMPIGVRTVYRALVDDAMEGVNVRDRSNGEYRQFERSVLVDDGVRYVVLADVASFYQYVDHGDLAQSLVRTNGKADTARAIRQLLDMATRQSFGLPQGPWPSDALSELVLSPVERRLARQGLTVARFSDDFRFGARTWGEALRAISALRTELHRVGLTLNEEKTHVMRRRLYEGGLDEVADRVKQTFVGAGVDLEVVGVYGAEDEYDVDVAAAAVRELLADVINETPADGLARATQERLLTTSYSLLTQMEDGGGLDSIVTLLTKWPRMARNAGRYMASLLDWDSSVSAGDNADAVSDTLQSVIEKLGKRLSAWESCWLCQPLMHRHVAIRAPVKSWLEGLLVSEDHPAIARSRIILALALHQQIAVDATVRQFNSMREVGWPDTVAALATMVADVSPAPQEVTAVFDEDMLTSRIAVYVTDCRDTTLWAWRRYSPPGPPLIDF